ncbi:hypothetical protein SEA_ACOLYTE_92 [Mycobacterium phage Acolyte]|nr:hypothetical protein SEA_ACOLYTE_92 [Mycobacterium phage Acolyte]
MTYRFPEESMRRYLVLSAQVLPKGIEEARPLSRSSHMKPYSHWVPGLTAPRRAGDSHSTIWSRWLSSGPCWYSQRCPRYRRWLKAVPAQLTGPSW